MNKRRAVVFAAAAGVLLVAVVAVGLRTDGSASEVLTGAIAVLVLALVVEMRLAQLRDTRRLRKDLTLLRERNNRTWESVHWARRNTQKLQVQLDERARRLQQVVDQLAKPAVHRNEWRQVEALQNLYALLTPRQAVPAMRGWAASPDLLLWIVGHVLERRPQTVLECGSGVSTMWIAYAMERAGHGRVISLEHDPLFAQRTRDLITRHGLSAYADVRLAPLLPVHLGGQDWLWYDTAALADLPPVDVLVVDGPPARTGPLARYPAGPLVVEHLAPDALLLLDDAIREEERTIAQMWADELGFDVEHLKDLEKQALVLRRRTPASVLPGGE
jgi:predicted O-methyltransferase YrrM